MGTKTLMDPSVITTQNSLGLFSSNRYINVMQNQQILECFICEDWQAYSNIYIEI